MEVVAKLPSAEHRDGELKTILKAIGAFRRGDRGVTLPARHPIELLAAALE